MTKEHGQETGRLLKAFAALDSAIFEGVRGLGLLERPLTRRLFRAAIVDRKTRGLEIGPIPEVLKEEAAIITSNYPGVEEALWPLSALALTLSSKKLRVVGVGRAKIVYGTNPVFGGIMMAIVVPADEDEQGRYTLKPEGVRRVVGQLDKKGLAWIQTTGSTKKNGLDKDRWRPGVAVFAAKKEVPVVPMGLITSEKERKVTKVKFGKPIYLPPEEDLDPMNMDEHLKLLTHFVMAKVAELLPEGQRGDFEDPEKELAEILDKLSRFQDITGLTQENAWPAEQL